MDRRGMTAYDSVLAWFVKRVECPCPPPYSGPWPKVLPVALVSQRLRSRRAGTALVLVEMVCEGHNGQGWRPAGGSRAAAGSPPE